MAFLLNVNADHHTAGCMWYYPKLCVGKSPFLLNPLASRWILLLGDLYAGNTLKSFSNIKTQFRLPQKTFGSIYTCCSTHSGPFQHLPPNATFFTQITKTFGRGHEVSVYYLMILKHSDQGVPCFRLTWERDLKVTFTDREWSRILQNRKKMSRELRTRPVQFMILNRVHYTLYSTHSKLYTLKQDPDCWRCQNGEGTLIHSCCKKNTWLLVWNSQ